GEIDDLSRALNRMRRTIRKFLKIGRALAAEREFRPLLDRVLLETIELVRSDGGSIYMLDDAQKSILPETIRWMPEAAAVEPDQTYIPLDRGGIFAQFAEAVRTREVVVTERRLEGFELSALKLDDAVKALNPDTLAFVVVPLLDRNQVPFGLLVLV